MDLTIAAWRFAVGKAILGFANRDLDVAALTCEGTGYIVGTEPGAVAGVPNFDHATLGQKIKTYAGGPRWTPHYVDFQSVTVPVIVVEAPPYGDPIFTLQKEYAPFRAGTIFHRSTAHTEPAGPNEIAMLGERPLRGTRLPDLDLEIRVDADRLVRLNIIARLRWHLHELDPDGAGTTLRLWVWQLAPSWLPRCRGRWPDSGRQGRARSLFGPSVAE